MANDFEQLIDEITEEAQAEGPVAVRQLEEFRGEFRLANQILELRKALGLTQKQLAQQSGIAQSEISRVETGAGNPTQATLAAIATPLGAELAFVSPSSGRANPAPRTGRRKRTPAKSASSVGKSSNSRSRKQRASRR